MPRSVFQCDQCDYEVNSENSEGKHKMANIRSSYQFRGMKQPELVVAVDSDVTRSHVVDVDQPRPPGDFLDSGIDFKHLKKSVKHNLKTCMFEDDREDLLSRLNMQRPAVIGGSIVCIQSMFTTMGPV